MIAAAAVGLVALTLLAVWILSLAVSVRGGDPVLAPPPAATKTPVLREPVMPEPAHPRSSPEDGPGSTVTRVSGIVLGTDGTPAGAGVVVEFLDGHARKILATTRTDGGGCWAVDVPSATEPVPRTVRATDREGGGVSPDSYCELRPTQAPPWMVLRLDRGVTILGRVVDPRGDACPGGVVWLYLDHVPVTGGGWAAGYGNKVEFPLTCDAEGSFRVRVRAAPRGRRAVVAMDGSIGASEWFDIPADADQVDLGSLIAGSNAEVVWTLRIRDEEGSPVRDAVVRTAREAWWEMTTHPRYRPDSGGVPVDPDADMVLPMSTGEAAVILAVGGRGHSTRVLSLDRRSPGRREATVVLRRRPSARVRLTGESWRGLVASGLRVRASPDWRHDDAHFDRVEDAISGTPAELPRSGVLSAGVLLENALLDAPIVPDDEGEFLVHGAREGACEIRAELEEEEISRRRIPLTTPGPTAAEPWELPGGRLVEIDCAPLRAWLRSRTRADWMPQVAAWLPSRTTTDDREGGPSLPRIRECSILAGGSVHGERSRSRIWVPASEEALVFGLVEPAVGGGWIAMGPSEAQFVERGSGTVRMAAPIPSSAADSIGLIAIQGAVDGEPVRAEGVPFLVSRRRSTGGAQFATGAIQVLSGADGLARVAVLPGSYAVRASDLLSEGNPDPEAWTPVEVLRPGVETACRVEFSWVLR
ncbi:MAG TPA: hypothetical protein VFS92_11580 [Planctomycetota bacterium]|nr:hypothetical protein [Planctomycetota bacterium]